MSIRRTLLDLMADFCPQGVDFTPLGELGTVQRGKRFVKADMVSSGVPCIHYGEIYTKYGNAASETFSYIPEGKADKLRKARPGDVIFVSAGESIDEIGKSVAWKGTQEVVIHDACYMIRTNLVPEFLAYYLNSRKFREQAASRISTSKISSISTKNVEAVKVPVPPLEVQQEIVRILDQFTQLEAELEKRRLQYAYYRDKLLSFDALDGGRRYGGRPWVRLQLFLEELRQGQFATILLILPIPRIQ